MQTIEIEGKTYNVIVTDGKPELVEAKQKLKPGTYRVGGVLDQLEVGDKIRIDAEIGFISKENALPVQLSPTGFRVDYGYGKPWIDVDTLITIPGEPTLGELLKVRELEDDDIGEEFVVVDGYDEHDKLAQGHTFKLKSLKYATYESYADVHFTDGYDGMDELHSETTIRRIS